MCSRFLLVLQLLLFYLFSTVGTRATRATMDRGLALFGYFFRDGGALLRPKSSECVFVFEKT